MNAIIVHKKPSDVLKEKGWNQHEYQNCDGECCLMGAVRLGIFNSVTIMSIECPQKNRAYTAFCDVLCVEITKLTDGNHGSGTIWNDKYGRTKEDVIALLEMVETKFGSNLVVEP